MLRFLRGVTASLLAVSVGACGSPVHAPLDTSPGTPAPSPTSAGPPTIPPDAGVDATAPPPQCSGTALGCPMFPDSASCDQQAGCKWNEASTPPACAGGPTACTAFSALGCPRQAGCVVPGAPAVPISPLVGTWRLGPGGGTESCQTASQTGTEALDPLTFTIAQLGRSSVALYALPDKASSPEYLSMSLSMLADGTAIGAAPRCFGNVQCSSFALASDATGGTGFEPSPGVEGGVEAVPMTVHLWATQKSDTVAKGPCTTQWSYQLVRQTCANGPCGACSPGAVRCSGNAVQLCNTTEQWMPPTPCADKACVSGACVGVCTPGSTQCAGDGLQTCDASGQWGAAAACPSGQACTVGVCAPQH